MIRFFDISLSLLAIIFLSPIMLIVSLILKITGENEIFYKQQRVGINGNEFGLLKFATMLKDSPNIGSGEITIKDDPRVLPTGKFLRMTKINELPQLFNVVLGDMSIIGPRPMVPNTFSKYPERDRKIIEAVKPGLSGIGSIVFRDEESILDNSSNPIDFYEKNIIPYKSSLEVWFVKNRNLKTYLLSIFLTVLAIMFPKYKIINIVFKDLPKIPKDLIEQ